MLSSWRSSVGAVLLASLLLVGFGCGGDSESDSDSEVPAAGSSPETRGGSPGSGGSSTPQAAGDSSGGGATSSGGATGSGGTTSSGGGGLSGGSGAVGTAGAASTSFETGLPADTVLGELTDEQYRQYCEQAVEYIVTRAQVPGCRYYAASLALEAQSPSLCGTFLTACLSMPPDQVQAELGIESDCTKPADCTATSAQMEACVNDLAEDTERALETAPDCSELTVDTVLEAPTTPATPASCVAFEELCPGALPSVG
jgi:hypothetical protein